MARATGQADTSEQRADTPARDPRLAKKSKRGRRRGGDPRTMPGARDLGDQQQPQTKGGMVKGT